MASTIQFSVDDLRTPEGIERVLRLFAIAIYQAAASGNSALDPAVIGKLVDQISPKVRNDLQAPGRYPLNLQGLLTGGAPTHTIVVGKTGGVANGSITWNSQGIVIAYTDPT